MNRFIVTMSYKRVAADLGMSLHTVRTHARNIQRKVGRPGAPPQPAMIRWFYTEGPGSN